MNIYRGLLVFVGLGLGSMASAQELGVRCQDLRTFNYAFVELREVQGEAELALSGTWMFQFQPVFRDEPVHSGALIRLPREACAFRLDSQGGAVFACFSKARAQVGTSSWDPLGRIQEIWLEVEHRLESIEGADPGDSRTTYRTRVGMRPLSGELVSVDDRFAPEFELGECTHPVGGVQ